MKEVVKRSCFSASGRGGLTHPAHGTDEGQGRGRRADVGVHPVSCKVRIKKLDAVNHVANACNCLPITIGEVV